MDSDHPQVDTRRNVIGQNSTMRGAPSADDRPANNRPANNRASKNKIADKKRRPVWIDPRFAVGVVLIVLSVVGVVALVTSANSSIDVLAARTALTPGQRVSASDLVPTSVRAGQAEKLYLRASDVPPSGLIVTRAVSAGELVPTSAVGSRAGLRLTSIVVTVNAPLAESIGAGSRVDVWAAREIDSDHFAAPRVLASSAIVVRIVDSKSIMTTNSGSSVELLVSKTSTAGLLEDVANGAAISVLPVDLPLGE
jgi:hypothetical protein